MYPEGRASQAEGIAYAYGREAGVCRTCLRKGGGRLCQAPLLPGPLLPASDAPSPDDGPLPEWLQPTHHCLACLRPTSTCRGLPEGHGLPRGIYPLCMSPCSPGANARWLQHSGVTLPGFESQLCHFPLGEAWANCPL